MNFKRTVLALAVAGISAAPMIASAAAHADSGSIYANVRYGISSLDAGGNSERVTKVQNFGSRYGMKGETDLGNGMTAFGSFEDGMVPRADGNVRDIKVGLKGDFGQVFVGDKTNHTWDTYMSTDSTWWFGGTQKLSDGIQKGITYMGTAGPVSFGVSAAMDEDANNADEETLDQIEFVASFDAGPVNIALGMTDENVSPSAADSDPVTGFVVKGDAGGFGYAVDFQQQGGNALVGADDEFDRTSLQFQGTFGNFIAQYGVINTDGVGNEASPTNLTLTYTQNLGPATLVYYEFRSSDDDTPTSDAATVLAAVLKYNIL
jgi:predicted porin